MAARVRVYPEFADVQSVQGDPDLGEEAELYPPESTPSTPRLPLRGFTEVQRGLSGLERAFSGLERAFSNLSRADNLSFGISVSRQLSDSSDATRSSEPTSDGQLRLSDSHERESELSAGRSPPQATLLSKLRLWLAAYVSVADYVTDVYTISVRPLIAVVVPSLLCLRCLRHAARFTSMSAEPDG